MQATMSQLVNTSIPGLPVRQSLFDLGYKDAGLDDNYQLCNTNITPDNPYQHHDIYGRININLATFPNMAGMVQHAHNLGLYAGWYLGNCICQENRSTLPAGIYYPVGDFLQQELEQFTEFGFDTLKMDGCGITQNRLSGNPAGPPLIRQYIPNVVAIENCNDGNSPWQYNDTPQRHINQPYWPFTHFRASGDIWNDFPHMFDEILALVQQAEWNNSRPGSWAYGDALITGNAEHGWEESTGPYVTFETSRTQFNAYCILSSPLVLGTNLINDAALARQIPIVTNTEAIAINQQYFGFSGGAYTSSTNLVGSDVGGLFLYKPLSWNNPSTTVAVMVINHGTVAATGGRVTFADVPQLNAALPVRVRDVNARADVGVFNGFYSFSTLSPMDSIFLTLTSVQP